jgi:uroporphyrinogen-III decarboxylase
VQVVQLFDSWAHHLTPEQFAEFSMPYAERVIAKVKAKHPDVPLIFHANGGESIATKHSNVEWEAIQHAQVMCNGNKEVLRELELFRASRASELALLA